MAPSFATIAVLSAALLVPTPEMQVSRGSVLDSHVLLTWYGNPRSHRMGALGEQTGAARVAPQPLAFAGIKLFYQQDRNLFTPKQVLALTPAPAVVVHQ